MDKLGRYEILEKIGEGGMGTVYKGRLPTLERVVAIKVLSDLCAKDNEFLERFYREARILSSLDDYSHVVQIHDLDQADGKYFYVMEYIPFSLAEYIGDSEEGKEKTRVVKRESRVLTVDEALDIGRQVLMGLGVIHKAGVIHRDISPQNLLMKKKEKGYRVKISDFGIAMAGDKRITKSGVRGMGKEIYTAPEQWEDFSNANERSDLYSVGVLMYRVVTGRLPIGRFKEPVDLNKNVSSAFNDWILRSFEYEPRDRFGSVGEMLDELGKISQAREDKGIRLEAQRPSAKRAAPRKKPKYRFRSKPMTVSDYQMKEVFKLDYGRQPLMYIENDYVDNGDGTIKDHATGLMWHKTGSESSMDYKEAGTYIRALNRNSFAGYSDWRLPTVEELASLLKPEQQSNGLYINPIFDKKQDWCWSADKREILSAWIVDFLDCSVDKYHINCSMCVRAVRSCG